MEIVGEKERKIEREEKSLWIYVLKSKKKKYITFSNCRAGCFQETMKTSKVISHIYS